jgi:hypothetical protein
MYRPRAAATVKPTTAIASFTRAIQAEASRRPAMITAAPIHLAHCSLYAPPLNGLLPVQLTDVADSSRNFSSEIVRFPRT